MSNEDTVFITVVTHNHLHFALALGASLAEYHAEIKLFVCVVDAFRASEEPKGGNVTFVSAEQLGIPQWQRFAFRYSPFELSCALKPFVLNYVADLGYRKLVYLDADIQIYSSMDRVFRLLEEHHLLLTPHVTQDLPEDRCKPTLAILRNAGIYNAGFIAVRTDAEGYRFINWWKDRCYRHCIVDIRGGYHVDQAWLDFAPAMFEGVCVVKDFCLNVCFWNLPHRPIEIDHNGEYLVFGKRLVFFHFSGLDPSVPSVLSKYQNRLDLSKHPVVEKMVRDYICRLDGIGRSKYESSGYGFACLTDGTPIQKKWREAIRVEDIRLANIEDPFDATLNPHLRWTLSIAAADTLEARLDWHQRTATGIGNLLAQIPVISWLYKNMRVFLEK